MKQKDIARALNRSTSTVSRVQSRDDTRSISGELKQRIISLAMGNGIAVKTRRSPTEWRC